MIKDRKQDININLLFLLFLLLVLLLFMLVVVVVGCCCWFQKQGNNKKQDTNKKPTFYVYVNFSSLKQHKNNFQLNSIGNNTLSIKLNNIRSALLLPMNIASRKTVADDCYFYYFRLLISGVRDSRCVCTPVFRKHKSARWFSVGVFFIFHLWFRSILDSQRPISMIDLGVRFPMY